MMDFILRETGATTKDDLSVVLGEFDIRSGSDSFDTNRFDSFRGDFIIKFLLQEKCSAGDRPDCSREVQVSKVELQRHRLAQGDHHHCHRQQCYLHRLAQAGGGGQSGDLPSSLSRTSGC